MIRLFLRQKYIIEKLFISIFLNKRLTCNSFDNFWFIWQYYTFTKYDILAAYSYAHSYLIILQFSVIQTFFHLVLFYRRVNSFSSFKIYFNNRIMNLVNINTRIFDSIPKRDFSIFYYIIYYQFIFLGSCLTFFLVWFYWLYSNEFLISSLKLFKYS